MANPLFFLTQSILAVDPLHRNLTVSTKLHSRSIFTITDGFAAGTSILGTLSSVLSFFFPPSFYAGYRRMVHILQRKGDESSLFFKCLASYSFADPFFVSYPFSGHLVPHTAAVVPAPHVFPPAADLVMAAKPKEKGSRRCALRRLCPRTTRTERRNTWKQQPSVSTKRLHCKTAE